MPGLALEQKVNQNPFISPTEGAFTLLQQKRAKDSFMLPKKHAYKSIKDTKIIIQKQK